MTVSGTGLREIKKQMTRDSIADAALQLALDKGLDHVTIEEIARVAFVSPRTFSNYFSCKEEAVVAAQFPDAGVVIDQFVTTPADEPPLPTLGRLLEAFVAELPPEQLELNLRKIRLSREFPTLRPFLSARYGPFEHRLRQSIATRIGTNPAEDIYPSLVAATAVSAIRSAIRLWAASGGGNAELVGLIREAFEQLEAGLPTPHVGQLAASGP
jgi:AcrR family transcriptional regulator